MGCILSKNKGNKEKNKEKENNDIKNATSESSAHNTNQNEDHLNFEQRQEKEKKDAGDLVRKEAGMIAKSTVRSGFLERLKAEYGPKSDSWDALGKIDIKALEVMDRFEMKHSPMNMAKQFSRLNFILDKMINLSELSLIDCSLKDMPAPLPASVTYINLAENQITAFPEQTGELSNLEVLSLAYNLLIEMPSFLSQLINLKELNLSNNKISQINQSSLITMVSLVTLNLSSNDIKEIKFTLGDIPSLEILQLSFNKIHVLPEDFFFGDSNLAYLHLNFNPLKEVSSTISLQQELVKIDLRSTKIRVLPNELKDLPKLVTLNLENTNTTAPPKSVVVKGFKSVMDWFAQNEKENRRKQINEGNHRQTTLELKMESKQTEEVKEEHVEIEMVEGTVYEKTINAKYVKTADLISKVFYIDTKHQIEALKPHIREFIEKYFEDEENTDKIILSLQSVLSLCDNYLHKYYPSGKEMEFPSMSSYFIGRIGNYSGGVGLLKYMGFILYDKAYLGLHYKLKVNIKNLKKVKEVKAALDSLLTHFKNNRMKDQFTPDFEFFEIYKS